MYLTYNASSGSFKSGISTKHIGVDPLPMGKTSMPDIQSLHELNYRCSELLEESSVVPGKAMKGPKPALRGKTTLVVDQKFD